MSGQRRYTPITDPSAWRGADYQHSEDWLYRFTDGNIRDIQAALTRVRAAKISDSELVVQDFELPSMTKTLADIAREIEFDRGFKLLRGLPIERWSTDDINTIYLGLSLHLGETTSQNAKGSRLVSVADAGIAKTEINWRAYFGNSQLHFHSDFTDVVGLLCIRPSKEGGVSRIVSAMTIFNTLLEESPEYVDVFYNGFYFDRKGEEPPGVPAVSEAPIPMLSWFDERLSFRFCPAFAEAAARRRDVPLTALQVAAIAKVDEIGNRPELHLDMNFQTGDIQYLNNYTVHHSRTEFKDFDEPERKRLLKRIWLCTALGRELAPGFGELYGPGTARLGVPAVQDQTPEKSTR
ncbi:TauD/TfdA family dioxygenase [Caballeronia sp. dw_19]|uniref:TauD/TfdA family dioxygenase n=1 Tax=Caballeronia sp. dw_19 TaxID=2719791 RepID=UPI001BD5FAAD|nr:TauD/TfdA family dioxygenase [Caballeronia sp. dw_19]